MLTKNKIKYLKSLQLKKYRLQERKFVVEGDKIVRELIESSFTITTIFASKNWIENHKVLLSPIEKIVHPSDPKSLKAASNLATHSDVIAEVEMPKLNSQSIDQSSQLHLYLDGIRDPGNMGTIIRTAAWFGLTQILCSLDCVDVFNSKVLQSTMGSFLHVEIIPVEREALKKQLQEHKIVGATLDGKELAKFTKPEKMVLLIGNEGKGISPYLLANCDHKVTIEKAGNSQTESLNAAISTAILLHSLT